MTLYEIQTLWDGKGKYIVDQEAIFRSDLALDCVLTCAADASPWPSNIECCVTHPEFPDNFFLNNS